MTSYFLYLLIFLNISTICATDACSNVIFLFDDQTDSTYFADLTLFAKKLVKHILKPNVSIQMYELFPTSPLYKEWLFQDIDSITSSPTSDNVTTNLNYNSSLTDNLEQWSSIIDEIVDNQRNVFKLKMNAVSNIQLILKKNKQPCSKVFVFSDGWSCQSTLFNVRNLHNLIRNNSEIVLVVPRFNKITHFNWVFLKEIVGGKVENILHATDDALGMEKSNTLNTFKPFNTLQKEDVIRQRDFVVTANRKFIKKSANKNLKVVETFGNNSFREVKMNRSTYTTKPNTKNKEKIKETVIQNIQKIIEQGIKETLVEETSTGESTFIIGKSKSLVEPNPILEESFPKPTHLLLHKTDKIKKMNKPNLNNPSCLIDILFLVDTSNNSAHTRGSYLDVIRTMISRTIIDSNAIQISIVAFSSKLKQKILFNFQKFSTFNDISTEIEYLQNDSGKPNIGETLNFGGVFLSDANEKTRKDSIKKVVLLSQGYSIDDTLKPVQMLRHNKIDIYCVSVIPRTKSEIQPNTEAMTAIAGDKEKYDLYTFDSDITFIKQIIPYVCKTQ